MVGLVVTVIGVFASVFMHGINPAFLFMEFGSIIIVVAGAFGATISSFPFEVTQNMGKVIGKAVKGGGADQVNAAETIDHIVRMTNRARAEGLLALEEESKKIEDPFFRKGIELAVDGTDPDALKKTMYAEITAMKERHKKGAQWCERAGVYSPTFGIIGAVFGLIATMSQLSKPEKVGEGIAGAFVATFWGVFLANGVMLPLANKLKRLSTDEAAAREMIMEGVLGIQGGQNPRVIEETLITYLSPKDAAAIRAEAGDG